jgi:hypothetical protein
MDVRRPGTLAILVAGLANACGTGAVDVGACKQIEEARCRQAPACGIPIEPPYFTSGTDVDACIRFYDDACLHGLVAGDPGAAAVNACVAAIQSDTLEKDQCGIVRAPQTDQAACGWLVPPASAATDAAADAPTDAAADAVSDANATADEGASE